MSIQSKNTPLKTCISTVLRSLALCVVAISFIVAASYSRAQQVASITGTNLENQARILVRSPARIEVRSQLHAPVLEIPFRQGDRFRAGDMLVHFDCSKYAAETKAARASARASDIEYQTKRKLFKYNAVGKDEVRLAGALSARANAELKVHQVRIDECKYKAPFDGILVETHVKQHEFPTTDKPLLIILDDDRLELQMVIPSIWLRWLVTGTKFQFEIDETGHNYQGVISSIGAEVDPVSQTIKVLGRFDTPHSNVLTGMSGTANFKQGG